MEAKSDDPAPVIIASADRPTTRDLLAGELVELMIRAQHGEKPPTRAAISRPRSPRQSRPTLPASLPPTYESSRHRRQVNAAAALSRPSHPRPLPGVGLAVNKPKWTTPPDGAWAATVDDDAHSTKVVVGSQAADVERWDWAGAISWVVVQRSDPSIVDEIYAEAVQDFYLDVETKIYGELSAAAAGVATSLGAAIAEYYGKTKRTPDVILMARSGATFGGRWPDAGALAVTIGQGGIGAGGGGR